MTSAQLETWQKYFDATATSELIEMYNNSAKQRDNLLSQLNLTDTNNFLSPRQKEITMMIDSKQNFMYAIKDYMNNKIGDN